MLSMTSQKQAMAKDFDPAIGTATRWQKGCPSPNPAGRPTRTPLTDAFREILREPFPKDKEGRTYAQVIAHRIAMDAAKGNVRAVALLADRAEGRVIACDSLTLDAANLSSAPADYGRVALTSTNVHEQLKELTARLRERLQKRRLAPSPANGQPA
jgi:uncharacterized protein DUF5681